jgi:1,4-alpha-glucan branching enzyme
MAQGFLAFVLHAHLPFVRHPEHEFFLEEDWLYEAIAETYLPLLEVFEGLSRDGVPFHVSMSLSPTLVAMLRDDLLRFRAERHLTRLSELVDLELERTRGDGHMQYLARHYRERLNALIALWRRWDGDLVRAFSALEGRGVLEILTCGATHAYLPLWKHHPEAIRAQVFTAVEEHERQLGRAPRGIWIPECGYFPGLDRVLAEAGLKYFLVDAHGILYGTPRPRYGNYAPLYCPDSGVAAFGRDQESSIQVWSKDHGYPGDFTYREFYRDIGWDLPIEYVGPYVQPTGARKNTGIKYHRITRKGEPKDLYDPYWAREKAIEHAGNFVFNRERQIEHLAGVMGRPPIVVAPYDAELFGHWWYEGPMWLGEVIRKVAADSSVVALTDTGEYLTRMPTQQVATPAESSWGDKGYHEFWLSEENAWIYPHAHRAAEWMADLARRHAGRDISPIEERVLRQAARELLLAQASDWAFILRSGTMREYAARRTVSHLRRFRHLAAMLSDGRIDEDWLRRAESADNLFPNVNWRTFA